MTTFLQNPSMQKKVTIFPTGTSCAFAAEDNFKMAFKRWVIDVNPNVIDLVDKVNKQQKASNNAKYAEESRRASALQKPIPSKKLSPSLFKNVPESVPNFSTTLLSFDIKEKDETWRPLLDYIFELGKLDGASYDTEYANKLKDIIVRKSTFLGRNISLYESLTKEQRSQIEGVQIHSRSGEALLRMGLETS